MKNSKYFHFLVLLSILSMRIVAKNCSWDGSLPKGKQLEINHRPRNWGKLNWMHSLIRKKEYKICTFLQILNEQLILSDIVTYLRLSNMQYIELNESILEMFYIRITFCLHLGSQKFSWKSDRNSGPIPIVEVKKFWSKLWQLCAAMMRWVGRWVELVVY